MNYSSEVIYGMTPLVISALLLVSRDSDRIRETTDSITFYGENVSAALKVSDATLCLFDSKTQNTIVDNLKMVADMPGDELRTLCLELINDMHNTIQAEADAKKKKLLDMMRKSRSGQ